MSLEVQIQNIPSQPTAVVVVKTTQTKIGEDLGKAYQSVFEHLQKIGVQPAGPPFCWYRDVGGDEWLIEAGAPINGPLPQEGEVKSSTLPSGKVAMAWHIGSYATLSETWTALETWLKENHIKTRDGVWEIYWTDPETQPDSAKWKTQLLRPVEN